MSGGASPGAQVTMSAALFVLQVPVHTKLKSNIGSAAGPPKGRGVFCSINSWVRVGIHLRLHTNKPKLSICPSGVGWPWLGEIPPQLLSGAKRAPLGEN